MLDKNILQQLSQLKQDIRSQKDLAQGTVRGSQGRFGFVVLDDGREAFLPPESMQRVFPGDRVEVCVHQKEHNKLEAELEKLISSPLTSFTGQYTIKGQAHFVDADLTPSNRRIFIPPNARKQCTEGDYVKARITRHPFQFEGKSQAKIESRIGGKDDAGIEHDYIIVKHELETTRNQDAEDQAKKLTQAHLETSAEPEASTTAENSAHGDAAPQRENLTELNFITIDAASTLDMDDAISAEATDKGWNLWVAIADPTSTIKENTPIAKAARACASSVYLPGRTLHMLPENLAQDIFSLKSDQVRPALACQMQISHDGEITGYTFLSATIKSKAKLSYTEVDRFLSGADNHHTTFSEPVQKQLKTLKDCCLARKHYRQAHALVAEDRADYQLILDSQLKISHIEKRTKNSAHKVVEEAMLATNCCAGELLSQHKAGIFSSHAGLRSDRLKQAGKIIKKLFPDLGGKNLSELDNFCDLIRHLQQQDDTESKRLLSRLKRFFQPATLSTKDQPHFGLGFTHYATVTSPIRRYQDFFNHLAIKSILTGTAAPVLEEKDFFALKEQLSKTRQACRQLEQWLICQYMSRKKGSRYLACITSVNNQGFNVKLDNSGVEGSVQLKTKGKKLHFDANLLTLTQDAKTFYLDQPVEVKLVAVDTGRQQIRFELIESDNQDLVKTEPEVCTDKSAT